VTEPLTPLRHNPDYLARDFNSLRTLLFDHLASLAPDSVPFEVASVESTLVEILAYVGDYLSYYQDAVATEAYLTTARQRVSVRRHARLVDYVPNEGCSARVWARIEVSAEQVTLPQGTQLLTRIAGVAAGRLPAGFDTADREVFETMHEAVLARAHNRLAPATPGAPQPGATNMRLAGSLPGLKPGDVLVFRHSSPAWAHPVRLTNVAAAGAETAITWHKEDSLPDALPSGGIWEILGNIVLADHGRSDTVALPMAGRAGMEELEIACPDLAFAMPYLHGVAVGRPAAEAMQQDAGAAEPAIRLSEEAPFLTEAAIGRRQPWTGRRDLVHASQFERVFAVEPTGGGAVNLRFGDGVHGRRLQPDWDYVARYRAGRGTHGNIGPNTLAHIVSDDERVLGVTNPMAGSGGADPEGLDDIRAQAPLAANDQRRCVTEADYVRMTRKFPGVRSAHATRAWSAAGSPVTVYVFRERDHAMDDAFRDRLLAWLASFKLIGDEPLTLVSAEYVVPEITLALKTDRGRVPDQIAAAIRARLVAKTTFEFGEPLDPGRLVAVAGQVPGVIAVRVVKLARQGTAGSPLAPIEVAPYEVIRLDPTLIDVQAESVS
jgi:hypothetical protein